MKKLVAMAMAAFTLAACNNTAETTDVTDSTTMTNTTENQAYSPSEGDVTKRDGKVMVWRNDNWVEVNEDIRRDNGVVIYKDGRVERNGEVVEIKEGEIVNETGAFLDRTGRALENAWNKTKEGVKEAGREIDEAVDINTKKDH